MKDDIQGSTDSEVPDRKQEEVSQEEMPFQNAIKQYQLALKARRKILGGIAYRSKRDPYRKEQEDAQQNYSKDRVEDSQAQAEYHGNELAKIQLRSGHLENEQFKENMALRREFANKVFYFVVGSAVVVMYLIWGSGLKNFVEGPDGKLIDVFSLSDPVLLALISAVTINLMGGLIIVMKYLFPTASVPKRSRDRIDPTIK